MNVATIGTGFIVDWFLTAVQESANISCVAMFSRKESSAHKLADKYEIDKIYTNLDDMLKDEEINFCRSVATLWQRNSSGRAGRKHTEQPAF